MAKLKSAPDKAAVPYDDDKWRVEGDLRTLRTACEIMKDKGRLAKVKKLIGEEKTALDKLGELEGLRRY